MKYPYNTNYQPPFPAVEVVVRNSDEESLYTETLPGIFVVGDEEGDEIILGRDVLNKLRVVLNGPANYTRLPPQ